MTRQHLVENIRQPLFPINTIENLPIIKHKSSFDTDDKVLGFNGCFGKTQARPVGNVAGIESSSHKTQAVCGGGGSNTSKGDEENEFDVSFEEDFFFDL